MKQTGDTLYRSEKEKNVRSSNIIAARGYFNFFKIFYRNTFPF